MLSFSTQYSVRRPENLFDKSSPRSDQKIIAELDSMMNKWMDSVPTHRKFRTLFFLFLGQVMILMWYCSSRWFSVKWNQDIKNNLFLKQSAALHATYYHLQIFIHRPFIPSPRNPNPISFPSLAICANAARSCFHVLDAFSNLSVLPFTQLEVSFLYSSSYVF